MQKKIILSMVIVAGLVYRLDDPASGTISKVQVPQVLDQKNASDQKSFVVTGALGKAFTKKCQGRRKDFAEIVVPLSDRYGMDWRLVTAVIAAESNFNPCAISPRGAVGLMQVTPLLAQKYRMETHELYEPEKNIHIGVRHLRWLNNRYNGDLLLTVAAYNAGEGAVDRFGGVPPYKETRAFVQKVFDYHSDLELAMLKNMMAPATQNP